MSDQHRAQLVALLSLIAARLELTPFTELGLAESADLLLRGEELVVKNTRHRWPLP